MNASKLHVNNKWWAERQTDVSNDCALPSSKDPKMVVFPRTHFYINMERDLQFYTTKL